MTHFFTHFLTLRRFVNASFCGFFSLLSRHALGEVAQADLAAEATKIAPAANLTANAANTTTLPGVPSSAIVEMLVGLGLVILVLFAAVYFLRKFMGGKVFGQKGPLRIISGLMISTRERIVLLEIEGTWLVVGIVPGQIKTLHTLPKGELPPSAENDIPFGKWLKHFAEPKHANK